jgi:hypothetical protein
MKIIETLANDTLEEGYGNEFDIAENGVIRGLKAAIKLIQHASTGQIYTAENAGFACSVSTKLKDNLIKQINDIIDEIDISGE